MALDLTQLNQYVQDTPEIFGRLVVRPTILPYFKLHSGNWEGKVRIPLYEATANLGNCCGEPMENGKATEALIDTACISTGGRFCISDFTKLVRDANARISAGNENAGSLESVITRDELARFCRRIDTLVFQGDTSLTNSNLKPIDGLLKQSTTGVKTVNITSGNVYNAIYSAALAIDPEAHDFDGGIGIFVGQDVFQKMSLALMAINQYHIAPPTSDIARMEMDLPGLANFKIVGTSGLNGTKKIIVTPFQNVHWATNLSEDHLSMAWEFDKWHREYFWYINAILGVGFGYKDELVVVASISDSVMNALVGTPVSVVSPLGSAGGIITE